MKSIIALICLIIATSAAAREPWPRSLYDPGAARADGPEPDLVLPMPCGGAMAFQKVVVSLNARDPLADTRVRLGRTGSTAGHLDFLHYGYLRGGFDEPDGTATYYYISRYELTSGQYKALMDPEACDFRAGPRDTLAQGELSWFKAVDLSRRYTEWLNAHASDALPRRDEMPGHLRLPTETEWSFAARGGEAVSPAEFSATRFPMAEPVSVYARFDAERLGPVGVSRPNPLGLYDMYGNAEEIMLEPFRMNAIGHAHGQAGGMVTRGSSYLSGEAEMHSAWRREWSLFGRDGTAQAQETFGMRLVIAAPVETSTPRLSAIRAAFDTRLDGRGIEAAAAADLSEIIRDELDPARKAALEDLQLSLKSASDQAEIARARQLETTLLASAIFLTSIWKDNIRLAGLEDAVAIYEEEIAAERDPAYQEELRDYQAQLAGTVAVVTENRNLSVTGYRELLDYIATDVDPEASDTARNVLARKLTEAGNTLLHNALMISASDVVAITEQPDMEPRLFLEMLQTP